MVTELVTTHPLVVRLLNSCLIPTTPPPRHHYQTMWNPNVVLAYFSSLPDNGDFTLSVYSHKLATLIALSCLLRVFETAAISVASIHVSNSAAFSIYRPRKTQHLGPLRSFSLPRLGGHSCPVAC